MQEQCKEAEWAVEDIQEKAEKTHAKLHREAQELHKRLAGVRNENAQLKRSLKAAQVKLPEPCSPGCSSPLPVFCN
jgi:uncharacterized membrane protein